MQNFYSGLWIDVQNIGRCRVVDSMDGAGTMIVEQSGARFTVSKANCKKAEVAVEKPARQKPAAKAKKPATKRA